MRGHARSDHVAFIVESPKTVPFPAAIDYSGHIGGR